MGHVLRKLFTKGSVTIVLFLITAFLYVALFFFTPGYWESLRDMNDYFSTLEMDTAIDYALVIWSSVAMYGVLVVPLIYAAAGLGVWTGKLTKESLLRPFRGYWIQQS